MGVLIKGMEIPKNCTECHARCRLYLNGRKFKHPNCPLIEIPTPHGRLIDADKLIDGCEKLMRMLDPEGKEYLRVFAIKSYLMWAAEYAVIEAEGRVTE